MKYERLVSTLLPKLFRVNNPQQSPTHIIQIELELNASRQAMGPASMAAPIIKPTIRTGPIKIAEHLMMLG